MVGLYKGVYLALNAGGVYTEPDWGLIGSGCSITRVIWFWMEGTPKEEINDGEKG